MTRHKFDKIKVYGDSAMDGKLVVKKKLKAKDTLIVSGTATISGKVKAEGDIDCQGQLTVNGETTLNGETTVNGELTVNGSATITGDATINSLTVNELTTPNLIYTSPVSGNPTTILSTDSGTVYGIDTSLGNVSVTLPNPQFGLIYTFIIVNVVDSFEIILPSISQQMIFINCNNAGVTTGTASTITDGSPNIGDKYDIVGLSSTQWHVKCTTVSVITFT